MTGPLLPVQGRCQARGFVASNGMFFGTAASLAFGARTASDYIIEHAESAFGRMQELLDAAGLARRDVCQVTVYLADVLNHVVPFNDVWRSFFDELSPVRACVGAVLQNRILVEMTLCAQRRPGQATPGIGT